MACYFQSSVEQFLETDPGELLTALTLGYAREFSSAKSDQHLTWWDDLESLRTALASLAALRSSAADWHILLEFSIPRKPKRIDCVLLAGDHIILLECKTGDIGTEARRQVEQYALLLHYFHKPSSQKRLLPIVVTRSMKEAVVDDRQQELELPSLPSYWIAPTQVCSWTQLPDVLLRSIPETIRSHEGHLWDEGSYRPTPTIIEAALALRSGLTVGEVAQSEASEKDIADVTRAIQSIVDATRSQQRHAIVFLTGVPGSGKTLVGLSLAHLGESNADATHFMSGNGPLVSVLQAVFKRHARTQGIPSSKAEIQAETLIEDVHLFAREYTERDKQNPPSNHVVVFDEAQRAWDLAQGKRKFGREHSEPTMLLKIMERHQDWACVVALVGGGQEINDGEAGLEEWGKALAEEERLPWLIYASPEVIHGGPSTANRRLFSDGVVSLPVIANEMLHLRTSNRSLRADRLASWVNAVLAGDAETAAALKIAEKFPLFLSRDLTQTRNKLRHEALGESRFGLVGSSEADRLRAEGLEPSGEFHRSYPWHHWYLANREDVRSSYFCEVFATEFEVQGLELDWVGLCWGGDLIWDNQWRTRKFWTTGTPRWIDIKRDSERQFRLNAYRVLLTRARHGTVIYVPRGDPRDSTRAPAEMDSTANYLLRCGIRSLRS